MTRAEHLEWCKQRALECLDLGNAQEAFTSMISDLGKHPETAESARLAILGVLDVMNDDSEGVRKFIEGFN